MHNVISMETAAAKRGHVLNEQITMAESKNDLLLINLPLSGPAPSRVLVLVADQRRNTTRLILSDEGGTVASEHTVIGADIPADYEPRLVANIATFFGQHVDQTAAVLAAGGAEHGNLTLARAVMMMADDEGIAASEALQQALSISRACTTWVQGVSDLARQIAAS